MTIKYADELEPHYQHELHVVTQPDGVTYGIACISCGEVLALMPPREHGFYWVEDSTGVNHVVEADSYRDAEKRMTAAIGLASIHVWGYELLYCDDRVCDVCDETLAKHKDKKHYFLSA